MLSNSGMQHEQQKKLILFLNTDIQLGKILNASAHMMLGMGHRIPQNKIPAIDVFFTNTDSIYKFRQFAYKFSKEEDTESVFSDFTHTMTEGTADSQLQRTLGTHESELIYFGVSICADNDKLNSFMSSIDIGSYFKLKGYSAFHQDALTRFNFQEASLDRMEFVDEPKKISIVLNNKMSLHELLNPMVISCLEVGNKTELSLLKLLNFIDKDGGVHPNISYHSFPILLPKNPTKQLCLAKDVAISSNIVFSTANNGTNLATVCLFGKAEEVELLADRKNFSLWKKELNKDDLEIFDKRSANSDLTKNHHTTENEIFLEKPSSRVIQSKGLETKQINTQYADHRQLHRKNDNSVYQVKIDNLIPNLEKETLNFWENEKIFERSVENRDPSNQYVLFDGPPFATGLPHYGHMLAGALKDVFPRYHTMKGQRVERRFGWDCHGVPVEFEVEKMYKLEGLDSRKQSIEDFNERCRSIVLRYTNEWRTTVKRLGRFIDMENDYKTMDSSYMESVWAIFKELNTKGLVYEGRRVLAYSTGLGTVLSDFEAKLNYKKVQDPQVTIMFPLAEDPGVSLLVWTTTPWTVPTNVAIAVNKDVLYLKVSTKDNRKYILAASAVSKYFTPEDIQSQQEMLISDIINKSYLPMFDIISNEQREVCFKVYHGDFVSAQDGTGLVHISPAFGEDDYKLGEKYNLPALDFFDASGCFNEKIANMRDAGGVYGDLFEKIVSLNFKEADKFIISNMKKQGRLLKHEVIHHEYPLCWRTDTPLMYRAVPSWYVQVTAIKDKIIENNKEINWYPDFVGKKRFHSWLENAKDWSISRNRYWGCPLPVWRNMSDVSDCLFIGSIKELEQLTGKKVSDIHSHKIDSLLIEKDGNTYRRVPEVFDCWFESGAMPYAQSHYPFENKDNFLRSKFPADFIAEGLDQTRGWFYTLMVLSTALFDRPAFKNCVVNGIILGTDGKKMSKLRRNYPNIDLMFDKYGADALRFVLLSSGATKAQEMRMTEEDMASAVKSLLIPAINLYKFFAMNANAINFKYDKNFNFYDLKNSFNKALVYRIELFKSNTTLGYEDYNLHSTCVEIQNFVDYLSQWYVRNIKKFVSNNNDEDQIEILHCLHHALDTFTRCAAPIVPFVTDFIFRRLHGLDKSVHLTDWPALAPVPSYANFFEKLDLVREIVHLGNSVRIKQKIRLRQPLHTIYLDEKSKLELSTYEELIKRELNVQKIEWADSTTIASMLDKKVFLNTAILGPKYKQELKSIQKAFNDGNYLFENDVLYIDGKKLIDNDISIELIPKTEVCGAQNGNLWVALDTKLDLELEEQGLLSDIMHKVQMVRKKNGLIESDLVELSIDGDLHDIVLKNEDKFCKKTSTVLVNAVNSGFTQDLYSFGNYSGNIFLGNICLKKDLLSDSSSLIFSPRLTNVLSGQNLMNSIVNTETESSIKEESKNSFGKFTV